MRFNVGLREIPREKTIKRERVCVCVCMCERKRERKKKKCFTSTFAYLLTCSSFYLKIHYTWKVFHYN